MDAVSRKADDLRRDPRFSVHSAPDGEELSSGDARVEGRAVPAPDPDLFIEGHRFPIDDPSTMALFTAAVSRVVLARVEDRSLVVSAWTPEAGLTETRLP